MASPASGTIACLSHRRGGLALVLALALMLAGCGGTVNSSVFDRLAEGTPVPMPMPAPAAAVVPTAEAMRGRWVLTMPGTGSCGMTFGTPGAEGSIALEGGCPGKFTASRSWAIEPNGVVIRDPRGAALAALRMTEPGRLEGVTPEGEQVLLAK
jgi:hypothetical protein